jgi:hypothetical protein
MICLNPQSCSPFLEWEPNWSSERRLRKRNSSLWSTKSNVRQLLWRASFELLEICDRVLVWTRMHSLGKPYAETISKCVGTEVLTAVVMKGAIFWHIAPCGPYVNRRFGRTYHAHEHLLHARWFLAQLIFYPEDGGDTVLLNVGSHRTTRRYNPEDGNIHNQ